MATDEFGFGAIEGDVVAFPEWLDMTVMKHMLTVVFWEMMDIKFGEGDWIHYILVDPGSMEENIEGSIEDVIC